MDICILKTLCNPGVLDLTTFFIRREDSLPSRGKEKYFHNRHKNKALKSHKLVQQVALGPSTFDWTHNLTKVVMSAV